MLLEAEHINAMLREKNWLIKGSTIFKTYKFETFFEAVSFVNDVADLAEVKKHYPEIEIRGVRVKLILTTEDEGGVTDKDVSLALEIDEREV